MVGDRERLAAALLSIADVAGMPDSYWRTDSRVRLARTALDIPADGRYSHSHIWQDIIEREE